MREALLYDNLPGGDVKCHVCQWRCRLRPGKLGACQMRRNREGVMELLNYGQVSSLAVDPIEKKPLYHFYPGSQVFSLGTWGCNFHCQHCQNWEISFGDPQEMGHRSQQLSPEAAVSLTKKYRCQGIAWTYNEPSVWFEYTLDGAQLAKAHNLYTVYVTNGYLTPEALDVIGPYLDAYRVDVKGFSDSFFRSVAKVPRWREILSVAQCAQEKWQMHVEIVTNVIPTFNDDDEQLEAIARWIRDNLGELTPWHVTRFYPHHKLDYLPPTPLTTLERAWNIGRRAGLAFVYIGNVPGNEGENTFCYQCHAVAVRRRGYQVQAAALKGSRCTFCQADLNFKQAPWRREPLAIGNGGETRGQ
ncbi:MAG: AmmeMemoRadiSam system radical SAM enzyme [Chloroflexi bacterium]|nr:AmmeMemoRadiSam system radical SAM enzyme [Chloroflexota bacterium]